MLFKVSRERGSVVTRGYMSESTCCNAGVADKSDGDGTYESVKERGRIGGFRDRLKKFG